MKHIFRNIILSLICIAIISSAIWFYALGGKRWYQYTFHSSHEPFTFRKETSTDPLYNDEEFKKNLENAKISDLYNVDDLVSNSIVIPGLKATKNIIFDNPGTMNICTSMTPQGVTANEKYVFISAYCHTKEHNTVIYMIDRFSHEFIKEIILPDQSHAGSITYDPNNNNLWVCCYDNNLKLPTLSVISMSEIEAYDFNKNYEPISYDISYPLLTILHASYMTYYDNAIYVGNFTTKKNSETVLERFDLQEDGTIASSSNPLTDEDDDENNNMYIPSVATTISGQMQGVAFCEGLAAMVRSYGSDNNSKLYFFDAEDPSQLYDRTVSTAITTIDLPPMAEEICVVDDSVIMIAFESGAYVYRARDCIHMDRILVIETNAN